MNDVAAAATWLDANQRFLCAHFALLRARLGTAGELADLEREAAQACEDVPGGPAIDGLAAAFGLTPFEREILLLCAATEMDARIAALCADGRARGSPTFGIALAFLPDPHWSALSAARPLRRWQMVEAIEAPSLVASPLRIDERVLHHLAGVDALDARLAPFLRLRGPAGLVAAPHRELAERVAERIDGEEAFPVIELYGDDRDGQEDVAAATAAACGLALWTIRAEEIPQSAPERFRLATLCSREALLSDGALLVDCAGPFAADALLDFVHLIVAPLLVAARDPIALRRPALHFEVAKPDPLEQRRLWQAAIGPAGERLDGVFDALAEQHRLSARAIALAGEDVRRRIGRGQDPAPALRSACLALARPALDDLAQRIPPAASWDDLVLPPAQVDALREIAAQVRHRATVHERWGFARKSGRGLGITALFTGDSGTGKTMAAEVLANDLGLELYRIDLSTVVSKYIGETEKNLRRVFDAAEDSGAILLFDEADALFGKRSEVKDSHDRYANIEVSYLLSRMEAYRGLAILTTNMKAALDRAFQRRLRFVVQFPFPDAGQRAEIWRRVFPRETPIAALHYDRLARLGVAGGSIRSIALSAAFHAAQACEPVGMAHVLRAARGEYAKLERSLSEGDTRGWV